MNCYSPWIDGSDL